MNGTASKHFTTVNEYIAQFPPNIQRILTDIRTTIKETVPEAEEIISYQMPAYKLYGERLIFFAAFKNHIGIYPVPPAVEKFKAELTQYKTAKGSIQFPLDKPIPLDLVQRIVKFRSELALQNKKQ